MKLSEKWKRWLRRLDLAVMVWWAAYIPPRWYFQRYCPPMPVLDAITILCGAGFSMLTRWLKVYESAEEPEEEMRWLVRMRTGLYLWPFLIGMIYALYLWHFK